MEDRVKELEKKLAFVTILVLKLGEMHDTQADAFNDLLKRLDKDFGKIFARIGKSPDESTPEKETKEKIGIEDLLDKIMEKLGKH